MEQVKVGMVGIGSMGGSHLGAVSDLPNAKLTAVCDINPERFKLVEGREDVKCFTDADKFFAEADMDAVIVATPHYDHPGLGIKALESGRHVLVEKPIGVYTKAARKLVETAEKHPELVATMMFNQRTTPAHKKIKQLIESGELGKITRVNWIISDWFRSQTYYDSGDWRATWAGEGGGVLLNQCPHQLDLMQWFFGLPKRIIAMGTIGKYHNIEVEDELTALLEYPDGSTGVFVASTGEAPGTNRLEITCDRGKLVYEHQKLVFTRTEVLVSKFCAETETRFNVPDVWNVEIPVAPPIQRPHRAVIENFLSVIQKGGDLIAPICEGPKALELGNAMLMAALQNREVTLPIDEDAFKSMLDGLVAKSTYRKKNFKGELNSAEFNTSF